MSEVAQIAESLDSTLRSALTTEMLLLAAERDAPVTGLGPVLAEVGWPLLAVGEEAGGAGLTGPMRAELYTVAGHHLLPHAHRAEATVLGPALATLGHAGVARAADALGELERGRWSGGGAVLPGPVPHGGDALQVWGGASADVCVVVGTDRAVVLPMDGVATAPGRAAAEPGQGPALVAPAALAAGWSIDDPDVVTALRAEWRLACVAECVGLADRMLQESLQHVTTRRQFGRPLVAFQAVAHRLADMAARVELARSVLGRLAQQADTTVPDLGASAELLVPAFAREVCESAIQVHGGMGFSWESGLHLAYRRALTIGLGFGGADGAAARVGQQLIASRRGRRDG